MVFLIVYKCFYAIIIVVRSFGFMERNKQTEFKKIFFNDNYMKWLSNFMNKYQSIDNLFFIHENKISDKDILMIDYLEELFKELHIYNLENGVGNVDNNLYCLEYNNKFYIIRHKPGCYSCEKYDSLSFITGNKKYYFTMDYQIIPVINLYNELKNKYSMEEMASLNGIVNTELKDLLRIVIPDEDKFYQAISDLLTPEEKNFIRENLINKSCMNCTNGLCRVEYQEKIGYDELGNPEGSECIGWDNSKIIGKSKVLKINDVKKL